MKSLFPVFLLLSIPLISNAGDFRKATWGMSVADVKGVETSDTKLYTQDTTAYGTIILKFTGYSGGIWCHISYYFLKDSLYIGTYQFFRNEGGNRDMVDFRNINDKLRQLYGKPTGHSESTGCTAKWAEFEEHERLKANALKHTTWRIVSSCWDLKNLGIFHEQVGPYLGAYIIGESMPSVYDHRLKYVSKELLRLVEEAIKEKDDIDF